MEEQFHSNINRELGGIQESLKSIHTEIKGLKEQVTIANGRTRKLEDWKLVVRTQTGLIAAIVSALVGVIIWIVSIFT